MLLAVKNFLFSTQDVLVLLFLIRWLELFLESFEFSEKI